MPHKRNADYNNKVLQLLSERSYQCRRQAEWLDEHTSRKQSRESVQDSVQGSAIIEGDPLFIIISACISRGKQVARLTVYRKDLKKCFGTSKESFWTIVRDKTRLQEKSDSMATFLPEHRNGFHFVYLLSTPWPSPELMDTPKSL